MKKGDTNPNITIQYANMAEYLARKDAEKALEDARASIAAARARTERILTFVSLLGR